MIDPMPRKDLELPPPVGLVTRETYETLTTHLTKIKAERDELDFILHEGGEDSVAKLIARAEAAEARAEFAIAEAARETAILHKQIAAMEREAAKEQAAYAKGLEEAIAILRGMQATPGVLHQPTINLAVSALAISATKARASAQGDNEARAEAAEAREAKARLAEIEAYQDGTLPDLTTVYLAGSRDRRVTGHDAAKVLLGNLPDEHACWAVMQDAIDAGLDVGDIMHNALRALAQENTDDRA